MTALDGCCRTSEADYVPAALLLPSPCVIGSHASCKPAPTLLLLGQDTPPASLIVPAEDSAEDPAELLMIDWLVRRMVTFSAYQACTTPAHIQALESSQALIWDQQAAQSTGLVTARRQRAPNLHRASAVQAPEAAPDPERLPICSLSFEDRRSERATPAATSSEQHLGCLHAGRTGTMQKVRSTFKHLHAFKPVPLVLGHEAAIRTESTALLSGAALMWLRS